MKYSRVTFVGACVHVCVGATLLCPVAAAEPEPGEGQSLDRCVQDLCAAFAGKAGAADFSCDLSGTWKKEEIANSSFGKRVSWAPGDVRCRLRFGASGQQLAKALEEKTYTLRLGQHPVNCEVLSGESRYAVNLTVDPEAVFKDGKATKVALQVGNIEAPTAVRTALWSAARLDRMFGWFEGDLVNSLNTFVQQVCPARNGQ